jgi:hypothetical protein
MGLEELKKEPMMTHLMEHLEAGESVGHYGRLVFAMVARHFAPADEVVTYLQKDPECEGEDTGVQSAETGASAGVDAEAGLSGVSEPGGPGRVQRLSEPGIS